MSRSLPYVRILAGLPALLALLAPPGARADEARFTQCLGELQAKASQEGFSATLLERTLATARYEPRVIDLDRRQPEFTETAAGYLDRRVTAARIEQGRAMLRQHRPLLQRLAAEYGVQPHYLLAFWGLESNYGGNYGNMPVLNALATLACDPRRSDYFTAELFQALRILDRGDVQAAQMVGSWAGAMGHTQFMPSAYLLHAVDGDGDGRVDLWGSVPDALASAANYLKSLGWQPGVRWGREVRLPKDFSYEHSGLDRPKPLAQWHRLGVRDSAGGVLPQAELTAALLVPAGHRGPAFLVYDNFRVIMRWNRSELYALSVGLLADRIAGAAGLRRPLPADLPRLHRDQVLTLQTRLGELGFDAGTPDGVLGPATRRAISEFQRSRGLIADGQPDAALLEALGVGPPGETS
ncbi:MAG: lytic murein transglycosylase [Proteobacteria bacterium]|nr:MAG: lytic murein transglycosylase [Pseudomonadota bacterium]